MRIDFLPKAEKAYHKLPFLIRLKTRKSIKLLLANPSHPSLHIKKMKQHTVWEARIDYQYRFTFMKMKDAYVVISIGPHDAGLGKK